MTRRATKALAAGRARAELYARSLGMRVVRLAVGQRKRRLQPPADADVRAAPKSAMAADAKTEHRPRHARTSRSRWR